jgi:ABC-type phosphate transport system substrate-binding protein
MRCIRKKFHILARAERIGTGAACVCALALFLLAAPAALCQNLPVDTRPPASKADIRIAGPATAQELISALVVQFGKSKSNPGGARVTLEYLPRPTAGAAARAVANGRGMILCWGQLSRRDITAWGKKWKDAVSDQRIIGARAIAIVVHPRNPLESMTREQIESVFSGKDTDWRGFGGERVPIQRYGLPVSDPLTAYFGDKGFTAARKSHIIRKRTSKEALAALSTDPGAIAYVDAAAAAAAGDTSRTLAIGGTILDVQSIKDGSYPLAEVLVMCVSPSASESAKRFSRFVLEGAGDALFRKHGFVPTLRAVRPDVLAGFQKLYGPDIARVKSTKGTADDLALARQILLSARRMKHNTKLLGAMCEAAFDLCLNVSGAETTAFEALSVLRSSAPRKKFDCALKRVALYEQAYAAGTAKVVAENLVEVLMTSAKIGTSSGRHAEAAELWRRAQKVAEDTKNPALNVVRERQIAFAARAVSEREARTLDQRLRHNWEARAIAECLGYDWKDPESRRKLLMLLLVELDEPAEAVKFLDAATDDTMKTNLPLAARPVAKLSEESALSLAEWYVGLANKAGVGGEELMLARARSSYRRFFALHQKRSDALATRAALGLRRIGGTVPRPRSKWRYRPPLRAALKRGEKISNLKLAEFVASHTGLTQLGFKEIGDAREITDLRPLTRLTRLTVLELRQVTGLKDLSPIGRMSRLTSLTLTGFEGKSVAALSSLSKLTGLNLSDAKNLSDLAPLSRLANLRGLSLSGCSSVADLSRVVRLPRLASLALARCDKVEDLSALERLAGSLTKLSLAGCPKVRDVYPLAKCDRLKSVDLRECPSVLAKDIDGLKKQLPDCKILSGPIKKSKKKWTRKR